MARGTSRSLILLAGFLTAAWLPGGPLAAQSTTFELSDEEGWQQVEAPEEGTDAAFIARMQRLLAEERAREARTELRSWIDTHRRTDNPFLARAYLLLGDSYIATGHEYKALFEYEVVINDFPASEEFALAVERELEVAIRYSQGLRKREFGLFRIGATSLLAEDLMVRVQERMPGSKLAERAGIELGDHYFRRGEMRMASEAYEIFLTNFPESRYRQRAMQRRIHANLARFKGPKYDGSGLIEASLLIEDFRDRYPSEAEQAGINDALEARLDESAGAQKLDTARWYLRRNDPVSARFTLRRLLRDHPRTVAASRAVQIMVERGWIDDDDPRLRGRRGEDE